jgi:hypothetical protein
MFALKTKRFPNQLMKLSREIPLVLEASDTD